MKTEAELIKAIAEAEDMIRQAKADLFKMAKMPEDERLAEALHSLLCRWNHIDGCGWEYESNNGKPDWNGDAHGRYLAKARKLIGKCKEHGINTSDALVMFKMVKE